MEGVQTRRKSGDALPRGHVFHADAALLRGAAAVASLLREHGHLPVGKPPAGDLVGYRLICFRSGHSVCAPRKHTHQYIYQQAHKRSQKNLKRSDKSTKKKKKLRPVEAEKEERGARTR